MSRASAPATVPDAAGAVLLREALDRAGFRENLLDGPLAELFGDPAAARAAHELLSMGLATLA